MREGGEASLYREGHWTRFDTRQGDIIIMDYRLYHYGSASSPDALRRPVAYAVFSKPGFRDNINQHEYAGAQEHDDESLSLHGGTGSLEAAGSHESDSSDGSASVALEPLFSDVAMFS